MNKKEMTELVKSIGVLASLVTKDFEKIGFINQIVQTPLRQANRKLTEIAELIGFIEYRKAKEAADVGENGSGDSRTNTDQQTRQIGWKTEECRELGAAYADLSEAMAQAVDKPPFENDWTRGIVEAIKDLG